MGQSGGEKVRVVLMGDDCGGGGNKTYNFNSHVWECYEINPSGSEHDYIQDFEVDVSFSTESISFLSGTSTSYSVIFIAGSSDADSDYLNHNFILDEIEIRGPDEAANPSTAFIFNAQNFSVHQY